MAYVPPLNGGRINASISGNTAGALSVVSTGTVVLAGGNNVTLSQNANTISISAGNQTVQTQNLHNLIINGNTTGTTANISSGTMSLAGGNNITLSQAGGNAVTISAANQSNQSLSFSAGSQSTLTAAGTFDARSYFLNGVGAASVGFSQSSVFVSVPQTSSVIGSGIVNFSSNGSSVTISAPAFSAGISSNSTVTNQMILAAGNNVTLSQSTDATGATLSIGAANQSNQSLSFSAGSQSTLTATGTFDARSYFLNGVGAASVGFSQSSVFVSVPTQSVESQSIGMHTSTAGGGTGGTSGSASGGQIRYNFYAGSNITLSQSVNGASGSLSVYGTSGGGGGVVLYDGAASISSGTARFSNSNGVSFGFNGQTITGSVAAQSNQTLSFSAGSQSTLTATGTFDARSYFLNGVGAASVGFSQSSVFVSVPTQSVESQSIGMHTSTAGGGTGGTSGSASGGQIRYNFYAGSNVTLSQSVNGASGSLSVYGGAAGGIALGDGANTISSGTARFSNSNGVSFGFNGQTITGSVAAQTNQTLGMYVLNNSVTNAQSSTSTLDARSISLTNYGALSAGFSGGSIQLSAPATSSLVGTNGISISSAGSTISVMPAAISTYVNMLPASTSSVALGVLGGTNSVEFYPVSIPSPLVFNALRLAYTASFVTSTISGAQTLNHSFGLYSNNAGTLSLISSSNMGFSMTNSSVSGTMSYATSTGTGGYGYDSTTLSTTAQLQSLFGQGGWRVVDLQFGNSMSVSPGMYWLGFLHRGSSANANIGMALNFVGNAIGILNYGAFGSSSAAMTSNSSIKAPYMGLGYYNASSALPSAAAISSINQTIGVLPIMTFIST